MIFLQHTLLCIALEQQLSLPAELHSRGAALRFLVGSNLVFPLLEVCGDPSLQYLSLPHNILTTILLVKHFLLHFTIFWTALIISTNPRCDIRIRDYFRNWGQHPKDTKKGHFFTTKRFKKAPLIWLSPIIIASLQLFW